jgi:hypothetical protein
LIEGKYLLGETVRELSVRTGLTEKAVEARAEPLAPAIETVLARKTSPIMKNRDTERILKEVLTTETTQHLRSGSLEQGLTFLRRRRQVQTIVRACAVVCLLLVPMAI